MDIPLLLVVVFGFLNYQLSDDLVDARAFGNTSIYFINADIWFLFLQQLLDQQPLFSVDVTFILLPVCRYFISFLRRTPLNDIIPFDLSRKLLPGA